jgi:hypothetical protein
VTTIDPTLISAYHETEYRVFSDPPLILLVGTKNQGLRALHQRNGGTTSAFVTAFNPYSQALDAAENAARQERLAAESRRQGLAHIPGIGQHLSNGWPNEPSFLILGLGLEQSRELGNALKQNAIVWTGTDGVA